MGDTNGWVLLLWEEAKGMIGPYRTLFGCFGPFCTKEQAMAAASKEPGLIGHVFQLFEPDSVGKDVEQ